MLIEWGYYFYSTLTCCSKKTIPVIQGPNCFSRDLLIRDAQATVLLTLERPECKRLVALSAKYSASCQCANFPSFCSPVYFSWELHHPLSLLIWSSDSRRLDVIQNLYGYCCNMLNRVFALVRAHPHLHARVHMCTCMHTLSS